MFDYVWLGSAPAEEACAQVGTPDYAERARTECIAYKRQLVRVALAAGKDVPPGAVIMTKSESHDYGTYYEVVCKYDDTKEAAVEFAYWLEENMPGHWDDEAREALGLNPPATGEAYDVLATAFGSTS